MYFFFFENFTHEQLDELKMSTNSLVKKIDIRFLDASQISALTKRARNNLKDEDNVQNDEQIEKKVKI